MVSPGFLQLVDRYLRELGTAKPSPHTLAAYRRDLCGVGALIAADGGRDLAELGLHHLTRDVVAAAFAEWALDHSASSVRRAHSAWSGFFNWLVTTGQTTSNPMVTIQRPRRPDAGIIRSITASDLERLLREAARPDERAHDPWPARDLALVATVAGSGIRRTEVITLRKSSLVREQGRNILIVVGKGRKVRHVPLADEVVALIDRYLSERAVRFGAEPKTSDPLFVTIRNEAFKYYQVDYLMAKLFARAGVRVHHGGAVTHSLRHTWAVQALASGASIRDISKLLGHTRLDTSETYLTAADEVPTEITETHTSTRILREL